MRDRPVRTLDPAARRHCDLVSLRQVDRDAISVEEVCDALDRGLERVRERELRDRFADDGEECAAALELEPGVAGELGRTQRVCGPHGEARELLDRLLVGRPARREPNLERAESRLAELERDHVWGGPVAEGVPVGLLDDSARGPGELFVCDDRPVRARDLEHAVAQPPDGRGNTTGRDRCEPRHPCRSSIVGRQRGERVADDADGAVSSGSRGAAFQSRGQPGELGRGRREPQLIRIERRAAAGELEHPSASDCGERDGRPDAPVEPGLDDRRRTVERLGTQPFDLRSGRHGDRPDRAGSDGAVSHGQPDDRNVRPGSTSRRLCKLAEDVLDRRAVGQRASGARQHRERFGDVGARPGADQSPKSRSTSRQIVSVSSTLIAIRPRRTSQKRSAARRFARERSIRARRRARS